MEDPLSLAEAARELGESEEHVRLLVEDGQLPDPPTRAALREYREISTAESGDRIRPGELSHLYRLGLVAVSAGVPADVRDRIDAVAEAEGITRGMWIAHAIDDALTRSDAAGSPNAGSPNSGSPDAGSPNAGSPNAGSPNAGL